MTLGSMTLHLHAAKITNPVLCSYLFGDKMTLPSNILQKSPPVPWALSSDGWLQALIWSYGSQQASLGGQERMGVSAYVIELKELWNPGGSAGFVRSKFLL